MARSPKRPSKDDSNGTPLDNKQRVLEEQEQMLREKVEKYQKLIEDAPKIAADRAREAREELLRRAASTDKRRGSVAALTDRRFGLEANVAAPAQQRRMRAERRQGRLTFFVLLLALAAAICYLYYTVANG
ncbi:MAG: hypothetical protein QOE70_5228 [Chthoniobacter sp.]|jgi:hypothetical protein|nr:hypothetical protein [Chthoniobacter sp.]